MKRMLSLILTLCLLLGLALPVTAAGTTAGVFDDQVRYSITDSNLYGWGLAFSFTLNASGVTKSSTGTTKLTNATLPYAGESCKVSRIGAVVTHLPLVGPDDARMTRDTAAQLDHPAMKDAVAAKLCSAEANFCTFAIRVVEIPYEMENTPIYVRPYVEIVLDGEKVTLYGDTACATYGDKYAQFRLDLPYTGQDVDGKGRLMVGEVAVLEGKLYMEIQDELDEWMILPNDDSKILLGMLDADGNTLAEEELLLPSLSSANASTTFVVDLPEGTATVKIVGTAIRYWTEWE